MRSVASSSKIPLRRIAVKQYKPEPINTSDVILPENLTELTETIAKNVHEVWAYNRIAEGWVYGNERNSELKTTPCLVPYEELPEIEKNYDRNTAVETLKLITKLGYSIVQKKGD